MLFAYQAQLVRTAGFYTSRLASMLAISLMPFWWLIAMPGWPISHEWLRIFRRMGIFAGQWRLGHALPIWSTSAFGGYGSPSPIIYHKLFNVLSASLWLLTGAPKTAVCLALVLTMLVACLGAACACRRLIGTADLAIESATAIQVAFATYTTTEWVMRDAMAEFCALAGVTWLFAWCLTLIVQGRFSWWLGPLLAAICLAHSIIALFCIIPVGLSLPVAVIRHPRAWRRWIGPACLGAVVAACLMLPIALASRAYIGYAALASVPIVMKLGYTHFDFARLFYEAHWHWGDTPFGLTLQIDPLLLAFGGLAALLCITVCGRRLEGIFLVATAGIMIGLQSDHAQPIYRMVPLMWWLQLTFRLQTFVVIALALCGALVLAWLQSRVGRRVTAASLLPLALAMSLGKPWFGAHPTKLYFNDLELQDATEDETLAPEPREYLPRRDPVFPVIDALPTAGSSHSCRVLPLDDMRQERATARFSVSCAAPGTAVLPLFLAPGMRFHANGADVSPIHVCDDGRVLLPMSGDTVVNVAFPTWLDAIEVSTGLIGDPTRGCPGR